MDEARTDPTRSIFRAEALRRYAAGQAETALPQLAAPRLLPALWALLAALLGGLALAWVAEVPIYAAGTAVVVERGGGEVAVVAFLPPEQLGRLRPGQSLRLTLGPAGGRLLRPIEAVEPLLVSPARARDRFGLVDGAALAIAGPSAVAVTRLGAPPGAVAAADYLGSVASVEVEVGRRRVLAYLPLVGPTLGGER